RGIPITIVDAPYDRTLLSREAVLYGVSSLPTPTVIVDPLVVDKAMDRWRRGKRTMEAAAIVYGVILDDAHDAAADAVAAGRVAQAIARRYGASLEADALDLHRMQVAWCAEQSASLQDYMRRTKDPEFTKSHLWPEL